MRHKKRGRKLSRTPSHRKALRQNMARALLEHERIVTTRARAKEARPFVEKLITLARKAVPFRDGGQEDRARYLHYYRQAMKKLQDKKMVQKLFGEGDWREEQSLGERYLERPGGYTRILRLSGSRMGVALGDTVGDIPELIYDMAGRERSIKMIGNRLGDNAPRVIFELVEEKMEEEEEEEVAPVVTLSEEGEEPPDHEADTEPEEEAEDEAEAEEEGGEKEADEETDEELEEADEEEAQTEENEKSDVG